MIGYRSRCWIALALPVALAACAKKADDDRNLDTLDNQLIAAGNGNAADPAMTGALQGQIMVDPALAKQANNDAVRPAPQPRSGGVPPVDIAGNAPAGTTGITTSEATRSAPAPAGDCTQCRARDASLTLGALASRQRDGRTAGCAGVMRYSATWANRLPADLPLYPDARVIEAAGAADSHCAVRAVSFATTAPLQQVIDWYYTRATRAGYSAEQQADGAQHVLGGTRDRDGGAFALFVTPRSGGGADVDLIANNGS